MKGARPKKIVDPFDYKLIIIITKIDLFKGYIDTTHVDEASLWFAIHCFRSQ